MSDHSAARILCIGDLSWTEERKCDLRFFFHRDDADFVHAGIGHQAIYPARCLSLRDALARHRATPYDVVVAGRIPFPHANPRKPALRRMANIAATFRRPQGALRALAVERALSLFSPRLTVIDLEDRPIIDNRRFHAAGCCQLYFKRELPQNPANAFLYTTAKNEDNGNIARQPFFAEILPKLRPISIGVEPALLQKTLNPAVEKSADVFFAGRVENRPNRIRGMENLLRLRDEGFAIDLPATKIPRAEFFERCARAHAVWSPEGYGYDCRRTYEAAAMGAAPILQFPTMQRHAPLLDGEHALYYGVEGDHLYRMLATRLRDRQEMRAIGARARTHVATHHAFDKLGDAVIDMALATTA